MLTEILLGALIAVVILGIVILGSMLNDTLIRLVRIERLLLQVWEELDGGDEDG